MILELGSVASLQCLPFDEQQKKKGAGGLGAAFGKEAWGVNFGREFRRIFLGRISASFFGQNFGRFFGQNFCAEFRQNFCAEFRPNFWAEFRRIFWAEFSADFCGTVASASYSC